MPVDHYENFPVASLLVPARMRPAVEALYAFARGADDIADEGDAPPEERLAGLAAYRAALNEIDRSVVPTAAPFAQLARAVTEHGLQTDLMRDLLAAFEQDVEKQRYEDFPELLAYCRRSANPVGRLMLRLFRADTPQHCEWSDAICSSLQLINFWQDVALDWKKGRIYLPRVDRERFNVSEAQIGNGLVDANWRALMRFELDMSRSLMLKGAPLAKALPGRFGWEIRLVVQGGLAIIEAIEAADYDVFTRRPTLRRRDWPRLAWRAARM